MSPLLKKVEKAGINGIKMKRKPFHIQPSDFFSETESVRRLYSQLIENDEPDRIVIIPSVSYGISTVVKNLPFTSGEIILAEEQFPSNVYPWLSLEEKGFSIQIISPSDATSRAQSWNEKILDSINEKTRVVTIGHVHWSDGSLFDLAAIRKKLDEVGGLLVIDGTQSIGALPFSVKKFRPDAVITAGYKWLMGPYSIGLAYFGKVFDNGSPLEENWINRAGSDDFSGLVNYSPNYRDGALRYEVGEHSNFILIPMLHTALKQLIKWQPEAIQSYCKDLTEKIVEEIKELGLQIEDNEWRSHHLFGLRSKDNELLSALAQAFKRNKISVSFRGEVVRIAPHVYNDEIDLRKLFKVVKETIFAQKN